MRSAWAISGRKFDLAGHQGVWQSEIQCREACFLRGRGYVLQRVQRRAGEAGRRADMADETMRFEGN